jgi:hypothetical protein
MLDIRLGKATQDGLHVCRLQPQGCGKLDQFVVLLRDDLSQLMGRVRIDWRLG